MRLTRYYLVHGGEHVLALADLLVKNGFPQMTQTAGTFFTWSLPLSVRALRQHLAEQYTWWTIRTLNSFPHIGQVALSPRFIVGPPCRHPPR